MDAKDVREKGRYLHVDLVRRDFAEVIVESIVPTAFRPSFAVRDVDGVGCRIVYAGSLYPDRDSLTTEGVAEVEREIENKRREIRELLALRASILSHPPGGDDDDEPDPDATPIEHGDPVGEMPVSTNMTTV